MVFRVSPCTDDWNFGELHSSNRVKILNKWHQGDEGSGQDPKASSLDPGWACRHTRSFGEKVIGRLGKMGMMASVS